MTRKKKKGLMGNEEKEMAEQIKKQLFSLSYERKPPCPARVELNRKGSLDDQFQRDMEETKAISLLKQAWPWPALQEGAVTKSPANATETTPALEPAPAPVEATRTDPEPVAPVPASDLDSFLHKHHRVNSAGDVVQHLHQSVVPQPKGPVLQHLQQPVVAQTVVMSEMDTWNSMEVIIR